VDEQLAKLGATIRLPGFRPGKIPLAVLEKRYGAMARRQVVERLVSEGATRALPEGAVPAKIELLNGADWGDLEFELTVTYLPDLAPPDFSELNLVRLVADAEELEEAGLEADVANAILHNHLKEQVLDHLNAAYSFPLLPDIVEREFASIWTAAEAELGTGTGTEAVSEFRGIAERRVRLGLVVAEMARRFEIRLTEDDFKRGRSAAETTAQMRNRLIENRVIEMFLSQARVTERRATPAELRDLLLE
jgi:FKBP-type peptidyl-prolyl cis-trans isomerase (trigger factor)